MPQIAVRCGICMGEARDGRTGAKAQSPGMAAHIKAAMTLSHLVSQPSRSGEQEPQTAPRAHRDAVLLAAGTGYAFRSQRGRLRCDGLRAAGDVMSNSFGLQTVA